MTKRDYFESIGLGPVEIEDMFNRDKKLEDLTLREVNDKVKELLRYELNDDEIRFVIVTNPTYFTKANDEIEFIITYLNSLGVRFRDVIAGNPMVLTMPKHEIQDAVFTLIVRGKSKNEIVNLLTNTPYLINEI